MDPWNRAVSLYTANSRFLLKARLALRVYADSVAAMTRNQRPPLMQCVKAAAIRAAYGPDRPRRT